MPRWLSDIAMSKNRRPKPHSVEAKATIGSVVAVLAQILGLQPGMVRAREYVSLEVSKRLHTLHRQQQARRGDAVVASGGSTKESTDIFQRAPEGESPPA